MPSGLPNLMQAAVISTPGRVQVEPVPVPIPGDDEVLIQVRFTGICGTDLHLLHGRARNAVYPLIPGHEFSGEVVQTGAKAADIPIGTAVVAEGRAGTGFRRAGAFAEFVTVPREMLHVLPPGLDLEESALVDPLACAIHAVDQARLSSNERVVIIGQGSSGLCMLQAARALVGCEVAVVDLREDRLALSRQFGAALAVNPQNGNALDALKEWAGRDGIACVLEATGQEKAVELALKLPRRDGRVVLYGIAGQRSTVEMDQIVYNQLQVVGAVGSPGCWPRAVELLARRKVDLRPMISKVMPLRALPDAFALLENSSDAIKVVIVPRDSGDTVTSA